MTGMTRSDMGGLSLRSVCNMERSRDPAIRNLFSIEIFLIYMSRRSKCPLLEVSIVVMHR